MEHLRHEVEVRCTPAEIPEALELDVSEMDIGSTLSVADLAVPEGVEVMDDPAAALTSVVPPTVHKVEEEEVVEEEGVAAEEGAEPEVVGRGKPAEGEEEAPREES